MATAMDKSELGKASDLYDENSNTCQPCCVDGKSNSADRFCIDCQEYLCKNCSTHHKALTATRNHALTTIEEAKKAPHATIKDKCSLKCAVHKDKAVKYLCVSHSYLGCSVCITINHKQCKDVDYIPTVADNIRDHDDFKKFDEKLKALETAYKAGIDDVEKDLKQLEADERQLKEAIKEFRKQLNDALDKLDHDLTEKAQTIRQEETNKLTDLSKKLAESKADIDTLVTKVDSLLSSGKNCDTFVLMKKETDRLVSLNKELVKITTGTTYQRYEFQPNHDLHTADALGKLNSRTETVRYSSAVNLMIPFTDGPSMVKHLIKGARVRRGKDWKWGDEDGGGLGTVLGPDSRPGGILVQWDNTYKSNYRMGAQNAYDLQVV